MFSKIKVWLKERKCYHNEPGGERIIQSYHQTGKLHYRCASCKKVWLV